MDFLARYLQKLKATGAIRLPIAEMRPCLLYADDALLFFKPDINQAQAIKIALTVFQSVSGIQINLHKSEILLRGVEANLTDRLASTFQCQQTNFSFVYLRIPLSDKCLPRTAYMALLHKISKRLAGWAAKLLSMASRLVLLNSVLSALPIYFMSVMKLPKWVIKEIDKIRRRFLWHGVTDQRKGYNLVNWDSVCKPKAIGGLGVMDLSTFNEALLLKWLWWWFQPKHRLCKPLFRATSAIAQGIPQATVFKTLTPELVGLFNASTWWTPGHGHDILFWEHNWGPGVRRACFPTLYTFTVQTDITLAQAVAALSVGLRDLFLSNISLTAQEELQQLCALLGLIHLRHARPDEIAWRWSEAGDFTVKSTYQQLKIGPRIKPATSKLWKIRAPPRMKLFAWLAARNSILTHDNLQRRGWAIASICLLCRRAGETVTHLFEECPFTMALYDLVKTRHPANGWPTVPTMDVTNRTKTGTLNDTHKATMLIMQFIVWRERCARIFRDSRKDIRQLMEEIESQLKYWNAGRRFLTQPPVGTSNSNGTGTATGTNGVNRTAENTA